MSRSRPGRLAPTLVLLLPLLASAPALAQSGWRWLQPQPTGADLRDLVFLDAQRAVACGARSSIVRSTDGGASWQLGTAPVGPDLLAVSGAGALVVAVGDLGRVLRSTDAGATFAPVPLTGVGGTLVDVHVLGPSAGFVLGADGTLFATTDGFATLAPRARIAFGQAHALFFDSPDRGWIVGGNAAGTASWIARTVDGGRTFAQVFSGAGGPLLAVTGISFFGQTIVVAAGAGQPRGAASSDGEGLMFEPFDTVGGPVTSVSFKPVGPDGAEFWFATQDGVLGARVDDEELQRPFTQQRPRLWSVASPAAGRVFAVGEGGTIVQATYGAGAGTTIAGNRAERFTHASFPTADGLFGAFADDRPGSPRPVFTTNGAATLTPGQPAPARIVDLQFVDASLGFGLIETGRFFSTANGGATWTELAPFVQTPRAFSFFASRGGYAVGPGGLLVTRDAGATWTRVQLPPNVPGSLIDVAANEVAAAAITDRGAILRRTGPGIGDAWTIVSSSDESYFSVALTASGRTVVGGAFGVGGVVRVGGPNGSDVVVATPAPVRAVVTVGERVFLLQDGGTVAELDGGMVRQSFESRARLLGLAARNASDASGRNVAAPFAFGEFGALLVFDDATPPPPNLPPVISIEPAEIELVVGTRVTVRAIAHDPEGGPVTISWRQVDHHRLGFSRPLEAVTEVFWEAGQVAAGTYLGLATACDAQGACADADLRVVVPPAGNQPPVASALGGTVAPERPLVIDGLTSFDPEGEPLTWRWTQLTGPAATIEGPADAPALRLVAPATPATLVFELRVCDPQGLCSRVEVQVHVVSPGNNAPPIVQTGADLLIDPGSAFVLDASQSSDPEQGELSFAWRQVSGPALRLLEAAGPIARGIAGAAGEAYRFVVRVCDPQNACSEAGINVTVRGGAVNLPPVVTATPAELAAEVGERVRLTVTATDPENEPVVLRWHDRQPELGLTLQPVGPGQVEFVAPAAAAGRTLTFVAEGCDPSGSCASATLTVKVAAGSPVVADAGPDQTPDAPVLPLTVRLDGSASTGPIASWRWTQTSGPAAAISGADAPACEITLAAVGRYVFMLEVRTAGGESARDEVAVTINGPADPIARAGDDLTVGFGARVQLDARRSTDPLQRALTFDWTVPEELTAAGADGPVLLFFAPPREAVYDFAVKVCARAGGCASDVVRVTVRAGANLPPVPDAGPDRTGAAGSTVALDGTFSHDPEGGRLVATWRQLDGVTAALGDPGSTWTRVQLPPVTAETTFPFELKVCDPEGACATDGVEVRVLPRDERTPTVTLSVLGRDEGEVDEDAAFELVTTVSCPAAPCRDDLQVTVVRGPPLARLPGAGFRYLAPRVVRDVPLLFEATACDVDGRCGFAALEAIVRDTLNEAPVPVVAESQVARARQRVVLDAARSYDPNGEPLTFSWLQLGGPVDVALVAGDQARARFVVPQVDEAVGEHTFEVTVCDPRGACALALTRVTVEAGPPFNRAPLADAGRDLAGPSGRPLLLDGTGSFDADGDPLSYAWAFPEGMPLAELTDAATARAGLFISQAIVEPIRIRLTVCDPHGACAEDEVLVRGYSMPRDDGLGAVELGAPAGGCGCGGEGAAGTALLGVLALLTRRRTRAGARS